MSTGDGSSPAVPPEPAGAAGDARDEVRARLVRAAATVFAREGYAGTKIMDIVREAGVSTGTVYGRFRSKNELLREAVVGGLEEGRGAGRHRAQPGRPRSASGRACPTARSTTSRRCGSRRTSPPAASPRWPPALADAYDNWRAGVEPLIAAAEAEGEIDGVDPEAVLFLYRTLYLGMLLHRASGMDGPAPDAWEALVDRIVAGLGRPPGTDASRDHTRGGRQHADGDRPRSRRPSGSGTSCASGSRPTGRRTSSDADERAARRSARRWRPPGADRSCTRPATSA